MEKETFSDTVDDGYLLQDQNRALSDEEKVQIIIIKQLGMQFIDLLHRIGNTSPDGEHFASRDLSLANTHAEDAVMRAVRHFTKKENTHGKT